MMTATITSAAIASTATTTNCLGSGFSRDLVVGQKLAVLNSNSFYVVFA